MSVTTSRRPAVRRDSAARIWAWPIALAVLSSAGLLAALVGDGLLDIVSWLTLGVPVAVTAWFVARRQRATER
ncbi:hypothetical protein PQJ75_17475 [Rhodoplanes sp. TEM]|uniref:Uncharacterized protein n=1 Tax=Rhodoplanes tepidamans TaxID=200616 RepID=A0ABT5JCH9_RHOTP|nr:MULTISPECIES: hypothetical protein [Rhodoplanes]MDC7787405.1 hypothetical protein [Rhodoplanes tepidamans]MDC7985524.1 hypothetical protein [Rhodoplanes sp. TEM]MDQ0358109.1 hypothetical protein [Rhodoplanes tepidamans]